MKHLLVMVVAAALAGCLSCASRPIATEDHVDIERFMGRWYVIASIPTMFERDAYNAVEHYELGDDGRIHTTFSYRDGGFHSPLETMTPTAHVRRGSGNAVWGMQLFWPFKAEYRILHVDEAYEVTLIGRSKRDYAWIMARRPSIDALVYDDMVERLRVAGYDVSDLRRVPQDWSIEPGGDARAAGAGA